jgi:hypothetical protein
MGLSLGRTCGSPRANCAHSSRRACLADARRIFCLVVGGQIHLRARHDDIELVACPSPRPFGAAIFYWRYLAEYPEGHRWHGQSTTELLDALRAANLPYVADPNTPALTASGINAEEGARLRASPMVAAVELPLQPRDLSNRRRRDAFADDTMTLQLGASAVAAPYLEYKHRGDEVLRMNIAMLRRCVSVAASQLPVAFIQVTASELRRGLVARLAPWYAATSASRVFLRVRGLDAEKADAHEFASLLDAIDAFSKLGVELVPDCVGRLGPPLVGGGAPSFSSGAVNFRKVSATILNRNGGGGLAVAYEVAGGFHAVSRSARHRATRCFVPNCVGDSASATLDDLRVHNMHVLREESRLAAINDGAWYAARLIESGQPEAVVWGSVLRERVERAA